MLPFDKRQLLKNVEKKKKKKTSKQVHRKLNPTNTNIGDGFIADFCQLLSECVSVSEQFVACSDERSSQLFAFWHF